MSQTPGVERLRRFIADGSRLAPVARLLGARVLSVEEGRILVEFAVKDDFMHPGGAVQGGIITEGPVVGEGSVLKKGRSTVFLQAAVRDGRGHDYAHATSVGSIRRPK